ncbi:hypothetical protein XU18_1184 [Perkinsela sp. CCAP 1560/4]|nr:hypothetical protein XU18_1184 [Perkinsela sp. CCAP 1560/4]|eukprot:KNH08283.1 hypothetical protein XU18_1184 [Perkinsela sp. CCAP 1560/4]
MFDKLKRKLRNVFDNDAPIESLTRAVENIGSCPKTFVEKNYGKKQYADSTFVPLQAETYDPEMIPPPSPASPMKSARTENTVPDEEEINIFEHQPTNLTETVSDFFAYSKFGLDQLRSTSAEQIERNVFSHQAENKLVSAFPDFFDHSDKQLIAWFQCTVLHGKRPLAASIYITKQCLFLVSKPFQEIYLPGGEFYPKVVRRENSKNAAQRMKEAIEITQVVSICRCIGVKKLNSSDIEDARTVSLMPLPDPGVEYNTIVLYLQDRRRIVISDVKLSKAQNMCQRLGKTSSESRWNKCIEKRNSRSLNSPIEQLYTYIDNIWRSSCMVPYPNVQYNENVKHIP